MGILIILLSFFLSFAYIDQVSTDKQIYQPGETVLLTVSGNLFIPTTQFAKFNDVRLEISLINTYFINLGSFSYSNANQPFRRIIPITLDKNLKEGVYSIQVRLFGYYEDYRGSTSTFENFGTASIKVENNRYITLKPKNSIIADKGELNLEICSDYPVEQLEISSPFFVTSYYIPSLKDCMNYSFNYIIERKGEQTIPVYLSYKSPLKTSYNQTVNLRYIIEQDAPKFQIEIGEIPRGTSETTLRILNKYKPVQDVRIYIKEPIKMIDRQYIQIKNLEKEYSESIKVFYDGAPGVIEVPLEIRWNEDGAEKSIVQTVYVISKQNYKLEAYLDYKNLTIGKPGVLTLQIGNLENYEINSIEISFDSDAKLFSTKKFVGRISPNDYTTEQINIIPREKDNYIKVNITFYDNLNNKIVLQKEFNFEAQEAIEKQGFGLELLIIPVIIVLIFLLKKWKKF